MNLKGMSWCYYFICISCLYLKKSLFKLEQETMTCAALMFQHQEITSLPARYEKTRHF